MSNTKSDWRSDPKARSKLRLIWRLMKQRCDCSYDKYYHRYGGRGIKVFSDWYDFEVFCQWAYEKGYDPYAKFMTCTLDRIDNDGDYCPDNCRWSSMKEQTRNTSRNHVLVYKGISHCLADWIELLGGKATSIYKRAELGMPPEKVLYPGSLVGKKTKAQLEAAIDQALAARRVTGGAS